MEEENCQDGEFLCIDKDRGKAMFTKDIYPDPGRYCDICHAYWEKLGRPWMIPGDFKFTTNTKGRVSLECGDCHYITPTLKRSKVNQKLRAHSRRCKVQEGVQDQDNQAELGVVQC